MADEPALPKDNLPPPPPEIIERPSAIKRALDDHPVIILVGVVAIAAAATWATFAALGSKDDKELDRYRATGGPPEEIQSLRAELARYRDLGASPEQLRGMLAAAGHPQHAECGPRVVSFPWEYIDTRSTNVFECGETKFTAWLATQRPLVLMGEAPNTDGRALLHIMAEPKNGAKGWECQFDAYPQRGSFFAASGCPFLSGTVSIDRSAREPRPLRLTATFVKMDP